MRRFKAALTTGYWPNNPEDLVRDELGEFVKYSDAAELIKEALEWNWNTEEGIETIPAEVVEKFKPFM